MEGLALRLRINTIAPGGSTGLHDHKEKPSIVYVVQGNVVEYRDGTTRDLAQGDVISQGRDHSHAIENRGNSPAVLLESEVIKKQ
jgi:quercetin dioxygenase-like cupin family protein